MARSSIPSIASALVFAFSASAAIADDASQAMMQAVAKISRASADAAALASVSPAKAPGAARAGAHGMLVWTHDFSKDGAKKMETGVRRQGAMETATGIEVTVK